MGSTSGEYRQSHEGDFFRELVTQMHTMPWRCADDARCDYLGPQWLAYIGEPRAPLGEYCWLEQLHPDDLPSVLASWNAAVARDQPFQAELRLRSALGSFRWFRSRASPLRDAAGSIRYWVGNSTDIQDERDARHEHARLVHELRTEMHARTYQLENTNAKLSAVAAQLQSAQRITRVGSWEFLLARGQVTWSDELFHIMGLGLQASAPAFADQHALFSPESWTRLVAAVEHSIASGAGYELNLTVIHPNGKPRSVIARAETLRDSSGRIDRIVGTLQDITESEQVALQLRKVGQRLQLATSAAKIGVWDWDIPSNVLVWDHAMHELYGTPDDGSYEAYETWQKALHPEDRAQTEALFRCAVEGTQEFNTAFRIVRRDGQVRHLRGGGTVYRDPSTGQALRMVGVNWDITEQRTAELALRNSEALQRAILAHAGSSIVATDNHGTITVFNPAAEQLLGYTAAELVGRATPSVFHDPEEIEHRRAILERELSIRITSPFEVFVTLGGLDKAGPSEWTYIRKDGSRVPVLLTVSAVRDGAGGLVGNMGVAVDLTDREKHERELLSLNHQLAARSLQAEAASSAKSEFLANMSHEIRTPMNGVLGMLHLVLDSELSLEQREYLGAAHASGEALLEIINGILDLAKIESGKLELEETELSLRQVLRDSTYAAALRAHAKGVELVVRVAPEVPEKLLGDPVRLGQVLINLLSNAVKFTEQGHVLLSLAVGDSASGMPLLTWSVSDTGIGIAADQLQHVFEPFRQADGSTTRRYGGTGLGLTICRELVQSMGGRLWVESRVGFGSDFHFALPLRSVSTPAAVAGASVARAHRKPLPDRYRALVVDDHPLARATLSAMLQQAGAEVLVAASAREASGLLALDPRPIGVVFVEQALESERGIELSRLLHDHPATRTARLVLLRSHERIDRATPLQSGFDAALDKPVLADDLHDALAEQLSGLPSAERERATARKAHPVSLATLDVLMVEDHPVNAHFMSVLLTRQGHRVVHAGTGARALVLLDKHAFDVVLMDVQMPEMDGLEATRRIRQRERGTALHVPIVALTANAMKGDESECLQAGMDYYLQKPISPDSLHALLARIVSRAPAEAALAGGAVGLGGAEAGATSSERPALNRDALLQRAAGDPQFMTELLEIFAGTQSELQHDLATAIASGDHAAVRNAAHRLKGALELICAEPSGDLARALELAARQQQPEIWSALLGPLQHELRRLRDALSQGE